MQKCGRARQATDDDIVRRMRIACWVTNATDNAPRQQWLPESAQMLRIDVHYLSRNSDCVYCAVRNDSVNIFFYYGSTTPEGLGLLYEVHRSRSFKHITLGTTLRLLWTSDQLVAETST